MYVSPDPNCLSRVLSCSMPNLTAFLLWFLPNSPGSPVEVSKLSSSGIVFKVYSVTSKKCVAQFSVPLNESQLRHSLRPNESALSFTEPDSGIIIRIKMHIHSVPMLRAQLLAIEDDERLMAIQDLIEMAKCGDGRLHTYLMDEPLLVALLALTTHWIHDALFPIDLGAALPQLWRAIIRSSYHQCIQYFNLSDGSDSDFFEFFVDSIAGTSASPTAPWSGGSLSSSSSSSSLTPSSSSSATSAVKSPRDSSPKSARSSPAPPAPLLHPSSSSSHTSSSSSSTNTATSTTVALASQTSSSPAPGEAPSISVSIIPSPSPSPFSSSSRTTPHSSPSSPIFFNRDRKLQMIQLFSAFGRKSVPSSFRYSMVSQVSRLVEIVSRYLCTSDNKSSTPRAAQEEFMAELLNQSIFCSQNLARAPHTLLFPTLASLLNAHKSISTIVLTRVLNVLKEMPPPSSVAVISNCNLLSYLDALTGEHVDLAIQKLANHNWSKFMLYLTSKPAARHNNTATSRELTMAINSLDQSASVNSS